MRKILVTTQFTTEDDNALRVAVDLAKNIEARIYLVNFFKHPISTFSTFGDVSKINDAEEAVFTVHMVKSNRSKLALLSSHYEQEGVGIYTQIVDDDLVNGSKQFVLDHEIDILITGENPSVTQDLVNECSCAVLSAPDFVPVENFKNILLAVDVELNRDRREAIKFVQDLSYYFKSTIHVVHVASPGSGDLVELHKKMNLFAKKYFFRGYSLNILKSSDEQSALINFGRQVDAGLYMILKSKTKGIFGFLSNPLSEEMMEEAEVPVMSVNLDNL